MQDVILSVQDLEVEFTLRGKTLHAIRGISLDICEGESLAIVGNPAAVNPCSAKRSWVCWFQRPRHPRQHPLWRKGPCRL